MYTAEVLWDENGEFEPVEARQESDAWKRLRDGEFAELRCLDCAARINTAQPDERRKHRKRKKIRPHFKHWRGEDDRGCRHPGTGESSEHYLFKLYVAEAVENVDGWTAEVEARSDHGQWIADVLANPKDPNEPVLPVAFEVQLSSLDARKAAEREAVRSESFVRTVWLSRNKETGSGRSDVEIIDPNGTEVVIARADRTTGLMTSEQRLEIDEFVLGFLQGDIEFREELFAPVEDMTLFGARYGERRILAAPSVDWEYQADLHGEMQAEHYEAERKAEWAKEAEYTIYELGEEAADAHERLQFLRELRGELEEARAQLEDEAHHAPSGEVDWELAWNSNRIEETEEDIAYFTKRMDRLTVQLNMLQQERMT